MWLAKWRAKQLKVSVRGRFSAHTKTFWCFSLTITSGVGCGSAFGVSCVPPSADRSRDAGRPCSAPRAVLWLGHLQEDVILSLPCESDKYRLSRDEFPLIIEESTARNSTNRFPILAPDPNDRSNRLWLREQRSAAVPDLPLGCPLPQKTIYFLLFFEWRLAPPVWVVGGCGST
jgi:hypothetical protein